jgi:SAM-dependent methyltransferase
MKNIDREQHLAWSQGGAADAWFERNCAGLASNPEPGKSTRFFSRFINSGQRVLEIGAANGHQLHKLKQFTKCEAFGIDPSSSAVADGIARYPELTLAVGTADRLDFPDEFFDAVIFGFCLCWVDRGLLMRSVAEADRVLKRGGWLMVVDFDPAVSHRRSFAHQPGLWSYKMCYPNLWLANPEYVLADKQSHSHEGDSFHPDPSERAASWVLFKQSYGCAYPEFP